jgi:hypothetical protein
MVMPWHKASSDKLRSSPLPVMTLGKAAHEDEPRPSRPVRGRRRAQSSAPAPRCGPGRSGPMRAERSTGHRVRRDRSAGPRPRWRGIVPGVASSASASTSVTGVCQGPPTCGPEYPSKSGSTRGCRRSRDSVRRECRGQQALLGFSGRGLLDDRIDAIQVAAWEDAARRRSHSARASSRAWVGHRSPNSVPSGPVQPGAARKAWWRC